MPDLLHSNRSDLDDPDWKIQGRNPGETAPQTHSEETTRQTNTNNSLKELAIRG